MAERIHPLAERAFAAPGLTLEPLPFAERISLRAGEEPAAAIGVMLGVELPARPGTSATADATGQACTALWLGPDEWLLVAEPGTGLAARLAAVENGTFSAVEISHRNTAIAVSGARSAHALNAGCPRDLSLAAFPVGACTRTILGKCEIVLLREAQDRFRVECWRSFSDYVWNYLVDAATSA
ncbi:MAG: sarcosine oxidase subunit gamma family protein [Pseudomonadota bacterium]|nr:sarcosine oxidase subunit gamma family protein [Pseudomonadota bacterium]